MELKYNDFNDENFLKIKINHVKIFVLRKNKLISKKNTIKKIFINIFCLLAK